MRADPATLALLEQGELAIEGQLVDASNLALYCEVRTGDDALTCIYKPVRGERPLWDFPDGTLAGRETAAFLVSEALGWAIVPPTVLRDGPVGPGMVQAWVEVDESVDLIDLLHSLDDVRLRRLALYDAIVNNADRKGGHLLPTPEGHLYGIDHGVCFSAEDKLRTVLWQWRGRPLPEDLCPDVVRLRAQLDGRLGEALRPLLTRAEVRATRRRIDELLAAGVFPQPNGNWPAVPWPPI
ncbi:MAG: hypothetical protein QOF57_2607 [Frankiaceae bacterium]|jgi:hypothetical protein|nr:hypothetical protein [Frankiaceae bacterium]